MTIAMCHLSAEAVVLGADSTTTWVGPNGYHYFNHAQKVFEIGVNGTLGLVTWGMASLGDVSYRTRIANLGDSLIAAPPASVDAVAQAWVDLIWPEYVQMQAYKDLAALAANPGRTPQEQEEYDQLNRNLVAGFCIGGYVLPDRAPSAFEIVFDPLGPKPVPVAFTPLSHRFWGVPNIIERLIYGADINLRSAILSSPHWTGSDVDLDAIFDQQQLHHPILPVREAVDFVHTCIRSTSKAMKFSNFPQVCGGPPEIAVITTDRNFRWVRHKTWDTAIEDGG